MSSPTSAKRTSVLGGPLQRAERASSKLAFAMGLLIRLAFWLAIWLAIRLAKSFAMSFGRESAICENDEIMQIPPGSSDNAELINVPDRFCNIRAAATSRSNAPRTQN